MQKKISLAKLGCIALLSACLISSPNLSRAEDNASDATANPNPVAAATAAPTAAPDTETKTETKTKTTKKTSKKTTKGKSKMTGTTAVFKTTLGSFTVKLFKDKAPKTVENFVGLATGSKEWTDPKTGSKMTGKPLYDNTIFHRVIPDFMIQAGDPLGKGIGGPGYKFEDEVSKSDNFDKPGILAMANSGPNTNGSQFFVTVKATPWLNGKHTIFGEVTSGMDIVLKISQAERDGMDRPKTEIKLEKVTIE
jgi:peptidyl-prolyl cis-trans isomerase A (cyclophilin A)